MGTLLSLISQRARDCGFELLARSIPADEPPWIYWYTESAAHNDAGESLLFLARPADAEPHLRRAVSMLDPSCVRDRGLMLLELAAARLGSGSGEPSGVRRRFEPVRLSRSGYGWLGAAVLVWLVTFANGDVVCLSMLTSVGLGWGLCS